MSKFDAIKTVATRIGGRNLLKLKHASPEILTVVGVAGLIAAGVIACKETIKAEPVFEKYAEDLENINEVLTTVDAYSKADHVKDLVLVSARTGLDLVKIYWPAISLTVISVACIATANGIHRERNAALIAAYKVVDDSFRKYRSRVVEEYGADKDRELLHGTHEVIVKKEKNGKIVEEKVKVLGDSDGPSLYARFFDQDSVQWDADPSYNLVFLNSQENWANDKLKAQGHLFLNEVYDALGIPRSQAGTQVGWLYKVGGDNQVDFGLYDLRNPQNRKFINGYEQSVLLDFNVDGIIWDAI